MAFYELDENNYKDVITPIINKLKECLENKALESLTEIKKDLDIVEKNCANDSKTEIKITIGFFGGSFLIFFIKY